MHFSNYLRKSYLHSFAFFPTNAPEIINIVSEIKNKNSSGYDHIPVEIMKSAINCITEPISAIINSSMITGVFPDMLKIAKICPIFKMGIKVTCRTTGLYQSYLAFQKYSKKL